MEPMPFVYSEKPRWRMIRHFSFWMLWFLFQVLLYSVAPSPLLQKQSFWHRLMITWPDTAIYLLPSLFLSYSLMYLVIPKLILPGRYLRAMMATVALIFLTGVFSALLSVTVVEKLRWLLAGSVYPELAKNGDPPFYVKFGVAMLAGLRGSVTVGGLAAAIKLMKCFYEKQQAALLLEKEKVHAELQMLKAQLHPHFLFNTLNNLYSFTQGVSDQASRMVIGISQLLRYMLYECNKPLVPVGSELKMIRDYMALETVRYDHGFDFALQLPEPDDHLLIAPLMLLPFIENAFKHGASQMTEKPWISLTVTIESHTLVMKLINGKPAGLHDGIPGIGISNVRKRLELLYPGAHELRINNEDEMFVVNLRLPLVSSHAQNIYEVPHEPAQNI